DDRRLSCITLLHQAEEDVGLFGAQIQVPHFVDDQKVDAREAVEQFARRAIGERSVHLVEEILSLEEQSSRAVLERFEQQAGGEAGFPHAGPTDEDDVLGAGNEVEAGKLADLPARDTGLPLEGEGFDCPLLGQSGTFDAPVERRLLLMMPLGAEQAQQKLAVGGLLLKGIAKLLAEDLADP